MKAQLPSLSLLAMLGALGLTTAQALDPIPRIERRLPPEGGVALPAELRNSLEGRLSTLTEQLKPLQQRPFAADVGALLKAVDYALKHGEFYSEKEFPKAASVLDLAETRLGELAKGKEPSWLKERGLVVRGYRSSIDQSDQPYGLEIPEALDLSKPVPLLVWLRGRGDKATDVHFIEQCRSRSLAFGGFYKDQSEAIVLHPFGRHCVGWKHAGEIDVFETIQAVLRDYPVDPDRIILAGFSMGGAGAWHIGAHYRDQFCGVHAGAGFAETKEYIKLTPDQYPAEYEQTLWKVYDTPEYIVNLLNGPLLAYSGEKDKQKSTADLMARELLKVGHEMQHIVAPDTEHKYTAEAVADIRAWLKECWSQGRKRPAETIRWQTPTLRYSRYDWLQLTGLEAHWKTATVQASWDPRKQLIQLDLEGVTALKLDPGAGHSLAGTTVQLGSQSLRIGRNVGSAQAVSLVRRNGKWSFGEPEVGAKRPGLQGPIDDAFLSRFVVVPPSQKPAQEKLARWLDFELDHFRTRWRTLFRGDLPEKSADAIKEEDIAEANLILWGDPQTNPLLAKIADRLPVRWDGDSFQIHGERYDRAEHVPVLIFPNPLNPQRYVVLNSGLTFREGHDRTNSLQNPKLPDWAVIGFDRDPDDQAPGRIAAAGFFDENWK